MSYKHNYYDILNVRRDATQEEIREAHRKLIRKYHPDLGGDTEKTKIINIARDILIDPYERKKFDQWLTQKEEQQKAANDKSSTKYKENNSGDFKQTDKGGVSSNQKKAENERRRSGFDESEEATFEKTYADARKTNNTRGKRTSSILLNRKVLMVLISIVLIISSMIMNMTASRIAPLFPFYGDIVMLIGWAGIILLGYSTRSFILTILGVLTLDYIFRFIAGLIFKIF